MLNLLLIPLFFFTSLLQEPTIENKIDKIIDLENEIDIVSQDIRQLKLDNFLKQQELIEQHKSTLKPQDFKTGKVLIKCEGSGFLFFLEDGYWKCHEIFPYRLIDLPLGKQTLKKWQEKADTNT